MNDFICSMISPPSCFRECVHCVYAKIRSVTGTRFAPYAKQRVTFYAFYSVDYGNFAPRLGCSVAKFATIVTYGRRIASAAARDFLQFVIG